jgi:hypothetical protein
MHYLDTEARRQLCRERVDELAREARRVRRPKDRDVRVAATRRLPAAVSLPSLLGLVRRRAPVYRA